jgi:hypothetical protein
MGEVEVPADALWGAQTSNDVFPSALAPGRLLAAAVPLLADRCVSGITAHAGHMRRLAESSPVIVTALNRYLGYEAAARVAHEALETGQTIRSVVISRGHLDRGDITIEQLDAALDVLAMTGNQRGKHQRRPEASAGNTAHDPVTLNQCLGAPQRPFSEDRVCSGYAPFGGHRTGDCQAVPPASPHRPRCHGCRLAGPRSAP